MSTYTILFEASGQVDVNANTPDEVSNIMHEHFKGIGVKKTTTQIIAIDGKSVTQRKGAANGNDNEIAELKEQVRIAKDAFFRIGKCEHSQEVHDIVCEAEFLMNHPQCRNEVRNG